MRKTIVLQVFDWDKITKADGIGEVKCEGKDLDLIALLAHVGPSSSLANKFARQRDG